MKTTRPVTRCICGRRMSQYATVCGVCHKAKMDAVHAESRAILATGKCPACGAAFRRNLSMTGWWQCEQLGAVGFRKDAAKPSCSVQFFTE